MNENTWDSYYEFSNTGLKAIHVIEPTEKYGKLTKEEAYQQFKNGLDWNVKYILHLLLKYSDNIILKKRLKKYGCIKSLDKLMQIEQTLNSLKPLLDEDTAD